MLNRFGLSILIFLSLTINLFAQTSQWRLIWSANTEDDMSHYLIFRGTASQPTAQIATVNHPDTVFTDSQIGKGIRYYYRLKAVDQTSLESDYSEEVSAAIPGISNLPSSLELPTDTTISLSLNNYVNDPDDADASLQWSAQGQSQIQVTINASTHIATIKTPLSWSGQETVQFRVQDNDGFFDLGSIRITVVRRSPQFSSIPDVSMNEDGSANVDLNQYVADEDSPDENLDYAVAAAANLQLTLNQAILTIKPDANWNGSRNVTVYVTDESALSDTATIRVVVNAVPDRPQFSTIPNQTMSEDDTKQVDLRNYAQDIDTPVSSLIFSVAANPPLQLSVSGSILTIVSGSDWNGERDITVYVRDANNLSDTTSFKVTVQPVSDRPQFSTIPQQVFSEDSLAQIDLKNYVNDVDTPVPNLTFSVAANPPFQLSVSGSMLNIIPTANWFGERTITVYVSDPGNLSDTTSFLVKVNPVADAPVFLSIPEQVMIEDHSKQVDLADFVQDVDTPATGWVFSVLQSAPLQLTLSGSILSVTPPFDWTGERTVIVIVKDNSGLSDTTQFSVRVVSSADSPVFSSIGPVEITEDESGHIDLYDYVTDSDTQPADLEFSVAPVQNLQLNIQGSILSVTPASNWFGNRSLTVYVTDETDLSDTVQVSVRINSVNDPPKIQPLPDINLDDQESATIFLNPYVEDVDHTSQEITWNFNNYFHIQLNYQQLDQSLRITSPGDWEGFEYVRATVTDDSGDTDTDTLLVRVTKPARAPEISSFPLIEFNEDDSSVVFVNDLVTDEDTPDQNLYWFARDNASVLIKFNTLEGTATFSAEPNWNGTEKVWILVTDPTELKDSIQVDIKVLAVNDSPWLSDLPQVDLSGLASQSLNLADYTTDVDHAKNQLQWSFSGNSSVLVTINTSGLASFSAPLSWKGSETISIYVNDPADAKDTSSVLVYSQDLTKAPQISAVSPVSINEDEQTTIDLKTLVIDPDDSDDQLFWQVTDTQNIAATYNTTEQTLVLKPRADWSGQEKFTLYVTDPDGNFDYATMDVTVLPINDPPKIRPIDTIEMFGSTIFVLDLRDYIIEPDGLDDLSSIELITGSSGYIGHLLDRVNYLLTFFTPAGFTGGETFWLKVTDKHAISAQAFFTVHVFRDNLTSRIKINAFGGSANIVFEWKTFNETKDYIEFGLDAAYDRFSKLEDDFSNEHQQILENLEENQTYHFRIVSAGMDGRLSFTQDSTFTTGSASTEINVFPIPYQSNDEDNLGGIHFTNLPEKGKLTIFNLLGEPVYKMDELSVIFKWTAVNNAGHKVSSGIYLYVVLDSHNKKLGSGKLIIVR